MPAPTKRPTHWADLGCGSGTFTLALAELLAPGSTIEAIDLRPGIAAQTTAGGVTIRPRTADFTTLTFTAPARTPRPPAPAPIPDRFWPGHGPLEFDGILMANALHYVPDQREFLTNLKTNTFLLIEYDIDLPVARWVPYPLSFNSAKRLLQSTHWPNVQKLGTHPSAFGKSELYAALALP
jgi:SAM-dependent methyltransferase